MTKNYDNKSINNLEKRIDKIYEHLNQISKQIDDLNLRLIKRERHDPKRIKRYISFDPEQYEWIEKNMESWKFASITHAVEWGLYVLKEKIESK